MKSFLEEYGFAILAAITVIILIMMVSPVGTSVKESLGSVVFKFTGTANEGLDSASNVLNESLANLSDEETETDGPKEVPEGWGVRWMDANGGKFEDGKSKAWEVTKMVIRANEQHNYSNSINTNDSASFSHYVQTVRRDNYLLSHWNRLDFYHEKAIWLPVELVLDEHAHIYVAEFGRFPNNEDYIYYTERDGQFYSPNAIDLNQFNAYKDSYISSNDEEVLWVIRSMYGTNNIYYPEAVNPGR